MPEVNATVALRPRAALLWQGHLQAAVILTTAKVAAPECVARPGLLPWETRPARLGPCACRCVAIALRSRKASEVAKAQRLVLAALEIGTWRKPREQYKGPSRIRRS
ncbi:hypothetical protein HPB50_027385 [Hyalomma asiaticum]|uniref:Uncharacterized protein n=1 Tax=Hyalomma asiaticum TaxID=266040 RepID=A0ACB7TU54_HYAAI|nr:hypothetical protein HPB50_027385 [Hyalomma asiaticum]